MPKLTMLSGLSGSGKSTIAKQMMATDGNAVRINRDDLRAMSITKWKPSREEWIIQAEIALAEAAVKLKKNIIIDDTNLYTRDEDRWRQVAWKANYSFEKQKVDASLKTCIERDSQRLGKARIGRPAIERQALKAGLWEDPLSKDSIIVDIDGTLADLSHRTAWITIGATCPNCQGKGTIVSLLAVVGAPEKDCPVCNKTGKLTKKQHDVFYSLVNRDEPIEAVVNWVRACHGHYQILIVSGRSPEKCGNETVDWLETHGIPYDHILMRRPNIHGPDTEEKQLILNEILRVIPKCKIAFVIDDRPSVVAMWKANGLRVFPVRGRDDDKFYEVMNDLEATHPRPDLEE